MGLAALENDADDRGIPGRPKKSLTAGALGLARKRGTAHPLLTAYLRAQHVNRACGGMAIAPWEIDELPEEWLDAAEALVSDLPQMAEGSRKVDEILAKWRREHRKKNG